MWPVVTQALISGYIEKKRRPDRWISWAEAVVLPRSLTVEVSHSGNVVFAVLANDIALVPDHNCCVPHSFAVRSIPLQYRRNDDHVVPLRQALRGIQ